MRMGGVARGRSRWRVRAVLGVLAVTLVTASATLAPSKQADADRVGGAITRAEVIARAMNWYAQRASIPYNMGGKFPDADGVPYRTDCSGFVSMAWHLATQVNTRSLPSIAHVIPKDDLQAGDVLDAANGAGQFDTGHVILFVRWTSPAHTSYVGVEFGSTPIAMHVIPYPNFPSDPRTYVPYRYDRIVDNSTNYDSVAWYRPQTGVMQMLTRRGGHVSSLSLAGVPVHDPAEQPLLGDWNGDGNDELGWYNHHTGTFHLRTAIGDNAPVVDVTGGPPGDLAVQPLVGDWNGDGIDNVGWYEPSDGTFHLVTRNAPGAPVTVFGGAPGGDPSIQAIAGDWNGDRIDTVGWYRPGDGTFHLLTTNTAGSPTIDVLGSAPNDPSIIAVAGDWNGDGVDGVGWYRPNDGTLELLADAHALRWSRLQQPAATGADVHLVVGRFAFDA